jgi:hypothetical protein
MAKSEIVFCIAAIVTDLDLLTAVRAKYHSGVGKRSGILHQHRRPANEWLDARN